MAGPSSPDERRLFFLLDRSAHGFRERLESLCRERLGVSAAQSAALFYLSGREDARAGELATAIGTRPAAVSGLLDRMESAGLVRRRADPDDGRVQRVAATPAGRRAVASAKPVIAAANAALSARFTPDELATVARFLRTVGELDFEALIEE